MAGTREQPVLRAGVATRCDRDPEIEDGAVEAALVRQRQRDTVQSLISSMILLGLLIGVLALITILSLRVKSPTIVTYQAAAPEQERVERPEVNQRARPNPPGQKSSRAKVIVDPC